MKKLLFVLTFCIMAVLLALGVSAYPTTQWLGNHSELAKDNEARNFYELLMNEAEKGADGFLANVTLGEDLSQKFGGKVYGVTVNEIKGTAKYTPMGDANDVQRAQAAVMEKVGAIGEEHTHEVCDVYMEFLADHPQCFWLTGNCKASYSVGFSYNSKGEISYTVTIYFLLYVNNGKDPVYDVRCEFHSDPKVIAADIKIQENAINSILALPEVANATSVPEKLHAINDALTSRNEYYTGSNPSSSPHSSHIGITALTGASGKNGPVCEAYANAFKILCDRLDIPCVTVNGYAVNSVGSMESHMWNAVYVNDQWYGVDVTWDDPVVIGGTSGAISGCECDEYFLVGGDTVIDGASFESSHKASDKQTNGYAFPLCNTAYGMAEGTDAKPSDPPLLPFTDVPANHKNFDDILYVFRAGLMNGVSGTTFAPNASVTRSMLVTILWRFADSPRTSTPAAFSDVAASQWYANAVTWASSNGIVTGYADGRFAPDDSVTCEQALIILARYAKSLGITSTAKADISSLRYSRWASEGVSFGAAMGIVNKNEDLTAPATRAVIAAYLNRFAKIVEQQKS